MTAILHDEVTRATTLARLGLRNGQMHFHGYKNRNWMLAHFGELTYLGSGDLSMDDLVRIQGELSAGFEFVAGWKDRHKDLSDPTGEDIRVTHKDIGTLRPPAPIY